MLKKIKLLCFFLPGFSAMAQFSGQASAMPGKEMQLRNIFTGSEYNHAAPAIQTSDGGYVMAGTARSGNGNGSGTCGKADLWIIKFSSTKILQWQKTFDGTGICGVKSIRQTADENYVIEVSKHPANRNTKGPFKAASAFLILKTDAGGNAVDLHDAHMTP